MIVMCSNQNGLEFGRLCGMFQGSLGHLYSPGGQRGPWDWMPYSLDNGAFSTFKTGKPFNREAFLSLCYWAKNSGIRPQWVLVPDVVGDAKTTLKFWDHYYSEVERFGWPLAFAAQDGHKPSDVPCNADVVFIGGTTEWKRKNFHRFCLTHTRVHVGRINTYKWLNLCAQAGAESVDGTGFFRGDRVQLEGLISFLEEQHEINRHFVQKRLFAKIGVDASG
jgi:hypothetical protein